MVQYIFTPWRSRRELLAVRRQFYPDHQPQRQPSRRQLQGQTIWPTTRNTATTAYSSYHATANGPSSTPTTSTTTSRKTTDKTSNGEKQKAVARVSMWMQRGGCPHMVESTALLTAAILSDEVNGGTDVGIGVEDGAARASRGYAVRAAYSAAFSRFVTGLLDSHQDKQRKMSMYDVAKSVGLPATFVELRHQATHEQLPSLVRLRAAADKALDWIWEYYWRGLVGDEDDIDTTSSSGEAEEGGVVDAMEGVIVGESGDQEVGGEGVPVGDNTMQESEVKALLGRYLESDGRPREEEEEAEELLKREIGRFDEGLVLMVLDSISGSTRDSKVLRRAVVLERQILEWREELEQAGGARPMEEDEPAGDELHRDVEKVPSQSGKSRQRADWTGEEVSAQGDVKLKAQGGKEEEEEEEEEDEDQYEVVDEGPAWVLYDRETWVPKPIGVV